MPPQPPNLLELARSREWRPERYRRLLKSDLSLYLYVQNHVERSGSIEDRFFRWITELAMWQWWSSHGAHQPISQIRFEEAMRRQGPQPGCWTPQRPPQLNPLQELIAARVIEANGEASSV